MIENKHLISTARLSLRGVEEIDLKRIHELHVFPEVDRYNTLGIPHSLRETEQLLEKWLEANTASPRKQYIFSIINEKQFVGLIALNLGRAKYKKGEVWYKIHPNFWNKGYATEALKGILDFAFNDLKMHRVEAGCAVENLASIQVLEKVGMTREGHKRKVLPLITGWSDNYEYAILEEDFKIAH